MKRDNLAHVNYQRACVESARQDAEKALTKVMEEENSAAFHDLEKFIYEHRHQYKFLRQLEAAALERKLQ